jgi:ankyrin repeat protein
MRQFQPQGQYQPQGQQQMMQNGQYAQHYAQMQNVQMGAGQQSQFTPQMMQQIAMQQQLAMQQQMAMQQQQQQAQAQQQQQHRPLTTIEQTLQMQGDGKRAHCAIELVKSQSLDQLRQWISRGQNMNIQDACGFTALMWTCMHGYIPCAKALINAGCDMNTTDQWGYNALLLALHARQEIIARN